MTNLSLDDTGIVGEFYLQTCDICHLMILG